jgi:outer membrane protein OmpA-like peptidoglycan-associated protein
MKNNFNIAGIIQIIILLSLVIMAPWQIIAQSSIKGTAYNTFGEYWYVGLNAGKSQYIGDLNNNKGWDSHFNQGVGGIIGHQISPLIGFRLQYLNGKLSTPADNDFKKSLDSKYWDCGYQVTINLIELFSKFNSPRLLNLYVFAGPSLLSYHSVLKNSEEYPLMETKDRENEMAVVIGAGLSVRLLKQLDFNLEYSRHNTFRDDYLDYTDLQQKYDKIGYASAGLTFRIPSRDEDKDGVVDKKDDCPEVPGKIEFFGCPDTDNDGIADKDDACPNLSGKSEFKGCPDTDNDGISDKDDACPEQAGTKDLGGCPDKDGDGIADKDDKCPDLAGLKALQGCPDKDNDGIADLDDRCPDVKGPEEFKGCPDKDIDGTPDIDDKCPDIAGPFSNSGCPETKKIELNKTIYFNPGQGAVISKHMKDLDEISKLMGQYADLNISIDGHADAIGPESLNLRLSEKRTDNVISYLVSKGINKNRLTRKFYGETMPAADNRTNEGRMLNRRVEIKTIK